MKNAILYKQSLSLIYVLFNICSVSICCSYKPFCFSVPNLITFHFLATNHIVQARACHGLVTPFYRSRVHLFSPSVLFPQSSIIVRFHHPPTFPYSEPLLLHICPAIHTKICAHSCLILHQKPLPSQDHEDKRFTFSEIFFSLIWLLLILTEGSLREDKEAIVSVARKKS